MQNKRMKQEFVLLAVPAELMLQVGIFAGDAIAISAEDGRLILENYDESSAAGIVTPVPSVMKTAMATAKAALAMKAARKARWTNAWRKCSVFSENEAGYDPLKSVNVWDFGIMMFYPLPKPQTAEPLSSGGKKSAMTAKAL